MGASPNTHAAVLKHVLQKAMKSPRKSTKLQDCTTSLGKIYVTPPKDETVVRAFPSSGSAAKLLKLYFDQLKKMSLHQFCKIWQLRNFNLTLRNLQAGQVLFVHDFQQNLLLLTQDETLSAHWDHPPTNDPPYCSLLSVYERKLSRNCERRFNTHYNG